MRRQTPAEMFSSEGLNHAAFWVCTVLINGHEYIYRTYGAKDPVEDRIVGIVFHSTVLWLTEGVDESQGM